MADLPDYYTQTQISEAEAAGFKGGLDANKPATPVSRDIYLATDTHILYVCFTDGAWTGFDAAMLTQGILTLYANMVGGGFQIKNIADPTAAQDAATRAYVLAQKALCLLLTGGTMSGNIAMGTKKITGLAAPTNANDAVRKAYADLFTLKSLFNANSILIATTDNTPAALAIAASRIVGRKSSGAIVALTAAEVFTILSLTASAAEINYCTGVTSAIQTQLTARVTKALFDANSILIATSDDTPIALEIPASRIVGRKSTGDIVALTGAEVETIIGTVVVRKASDESVNDSEVMQNDNELLLAVAINEVWAFEMYLLTTSVSDTPDIDIGFAVPANARVDWCIIYFGANATNELGMGQINLSIKTIMAGAGAIRLVAKISGVITVTDTAGNLQLQWAQHIATAENTTMKAGSCLIAHRLP